MGSQIKGCQLTLHLQAVVPAISRWIVALEPAKAGFAPEGPRSDPIYGLPGFSALHDTAVLDYLTCSITTHLDSHHRWHEFAQHGLQSFLRHLCASMHLAVQLSMELGFEGYMSMHHGFDALSAASESPLPCMSSQWCCIAGHHSPGELGVGCMSLVI